MNLYCATVDCWYRRTHRGKPFRRTQRILLEAISTMDVDKIAVKIAQANALFGPLLLAVEYRGHHSVTLPAGLKLLRRDGRVS